MSKIFADNIYWRIPETYSHSYNIYEDHIQIVVKFDSTPGMDVRIKLKSGNIYTVNFHDGSGKCKHSKDLPLIAIVPYIVKIGAELKRKHQNNDTGDWEYISMY